MEQITCYKAYNGRLFTEEKKCVEYESQLRSLYRMYDWNGSIVHTTSMAIIVEFFEKEGVEGTGADAFIKQCKYECSPSDGVSAGDLGVYYWDEYLDKYTPITYDILKALQSIRFGGM